MTIEKEDSQIIPIRRDASTSLELASASTTQIHGKDDVQWFTAGVEGCVAGTGCRRPEGCIAGRWVPGSLSSLVSRRWLAAPAARSARCRAVAGEERRRVNRNLGFTDLGV
nr:hypothetical protein Itr_chr04CG22380 [Ipomoea trifida]